MKKVLMIAALMIAALGANAQDKVEIKAGVGVAQINGINQDSKVGFNLGIGYQMNLDGNVYVEPSVMYENKGFKIDIYRLALQRFSLFKCIDFGSIVSVLLRTVHLISDPCS